MGAIFVREVFQGDAKAQAEVMVNDVRNAFKRNFQNLKWMDSETRKAAEIKADAISDMIGKCMAVREALTYLGRSRVSRVHLEPGSAG